MVLPMTNICGHQPPTTGEAFGRMDFDRSPDLHNFNAFAWEVVSRSDLGKISWKHFASGVIRAYPREDVFIHVWDPELRTLHSDERFHDIHDHRYTVVSTILKGRLTDVRYEVTSSENGSVELYEVRHDQRTLRMVGKVNVTETSRTVHEEGAVYVVPKTVWHKTLVQEPGCITFVYPMDNDERHPARQLGSDSIQVSEAVRNKAAARMKQLLSAIGHISSKEKGKS